jgi:hypothetical protein
MDLRTAIMARYAVKIKAYLKFDHAAGCNGFMYYHYGPLREIETN